MQRTSANRTSAGDPARTLELLWQPGRPRRRRGPKPARTPRDVVKAALDLADAEGLDGVSMRRLAERLGIAPMALYTYVPGRAELVDLMVDAAYLKIRRTRARKRTWRARLEAVAHDNRRLFQRHPWLAEVATLRPPLGPGQLAKYEYELAALERSGLDDLEMDAALTFVLGFVEACARATASAGAYRRDTGKNDQAWWNVAGPLLAKLVDPARYPLASRVGSASGAARGTPYDPAHAFEFGLARVLDGIEALVARRRKHIAPHRG